MLKSNVYICFLIFQIANVSQAQIVFENTYGSSYFEEAKAVKQTPDGGYIIGGTMLVKVDASGNEEWTKPYISTYANTTDDQGYILINSNSPTIIFTKVDQNGDVLWQTNYSQGIWANHGRYIEQADDGGYIVAGNYQDVAGSGMLLLKLDSLGNKLWQRTFSEATSAAFCHGFSAQQTNDNGYIIAGYTYIDYYTESIHKDVFVVKTDSLGNEQWRKYFGGEMDDIGSYVKQDALGNFFIAATTSSYGVGTESNMYLVKLDSNGDSLWTKTYGGELEDTATGLWPTDEGGCILVGQSNSFSSTSGDLNAYVVNTNSVGDSLWTINYGGSGIEGLNSVQQTFDDGYIMAGFTNSIGAGDFDMLLLKTDSLGNLDFNTGVIEAHSSSHNYKVHPNPVSERLVVKSDEKISSPLIIRNIHGEIVARYPTEMRRLDVSFLKNGVYFLHLVINNTPITEKFIIMN